jgi:cell volume regulation protein A
VLISWCGLRGAVPLALSFSVIEAIAKINGIDPQLVQPLMDNAEVIVFRAVVLNLLIQGLSLPHLCRFLGIAQDRTLPEPDQSVA